MRKSFKKRSNQILSVFVLLPFIAQTFVTPLLALDEILPEIQVEEDISETEVDIPIDTSEDILEEGISDPEEIAKPIWVTSEESATTFSPVVLGEKYVYPHNSDVTVVFSSLPEVSGTLTIKTVYLTDEQVKATNAASNVAFDITTDMVDGTFNYDLTLPKVGESNMVVYAESVNELVDAKDITNVIENESSLKIEDLDHFTVFVIANVEEATPWDWVHRTGEWTKRSTGNASSSLMQPTGNVLDMGRIIGLGSDYVKMGRPGTGTGNRAFLGYDAFDSDFPWEKIKLSDTKIKNISWQSYSNQSNFDQYLNIYITNFNPFSSEPLRTIVYVPGNAVSGQWTTYSTANAGTFWVTNDNTTYTDFSSILNAYKDWYIIPDLDAYSGLVIVSGSSGPSTSLEYYVDNVIISYNNGQSDTFLFENTVDNVKPSVTITPALASPTNVVSIPFNVVFNENVYGLEATDFTVSNGTISDLTSTDSSHYSLNISTTNSIPGNILVSLPANIVFDESGNSNLASTSSPIFFDNSAPVLNVSGLQYVPGVYPYFVTNSKIPVLIGTISGDSWENINNFQVSSTVDGNTVGVNSSSGNWYINLPTLSDGIHNVSITAKDPTNNQTVLNQSITIDSSAPTATYKHFKDETEVYGTQYVKNVSQLKFQGTYTDSSPSSGIIADSYVIFQAQNDGTFAYQNNGKLAYCSWRNPSNTLTLVGGSSETSGLIDFSNCNSNITDGEYYIAHQVYDNAYRFDIAPVKQFRDVLGLKFVVDTIAPSVPTNGQPNNSIIPTNEFDFTWNASTDTSAITYEFQSSVDPAESNGVLTTGPWKSGTLFSNTIHSSGSQDGKWYWQVRAKDTAGNYSNWSEIWNVTIDTQAPSKPVITNTTEFTNVNNVTINWTGGDDQGTNPSGVKGYLFRYVFTPANGGPVVNWSSGLVLVGNPKVRTGIFGHGEGKYVMYVQTVDMAGNLSPESDSYTITYDNTAPVVTLTSPSDNYYTKQTAVRQEWTANATDIHHYEYRSCSNDPDIDGNCTKVHGENTGTNAFRTANNNNISFHWQVRAVDLASNVGNWSTARKITIDGVGPTVSFSGLRHYDYRYPSTPVDTTNTSTNDNTPIVLISASDSLSGMSSVTVNGQTATYEGGTYWVELTTLPEGTNHLIIVGTDNAGNITEVTQSIFIDTVAPWAEYTYYRIGTPITDSIAYVKGVNELSFTAQYSDGTQSSGILKDSYVIFDSNAAGTARTSVAYCKWRDSANTLTITENPIPLTSAVPFANCEASLADGKYFIYHQVYDNATRKDIPSITQYRDVKGLHFVVDSKAPEITISAYSTDWTNQDIVVTATTNEETLYASSHTFTENGTFDFVATDKAGNTTTETVIIDNIDKTTPTINSMNISNGLLTVSPADTISNVKSVEVQINGGTWTPYTPGMDLYELVSNEPGTYTVSVRVTDNANNTTTDNTSFTIPQPPSTTTPTTTTTPAGQTLGVATTTLTEETSEEEVLGETTCEATYKISGTIYYDKNNNGKYDEDEKVVEGIEVNIYNDKDELVKTVTTDDKGYWEVSLCPGEYTTQVEGAEDQTVVLGASDTTLDVSVKEPTNWLLIVLIGLAVLILLGVIVDRSKKKKEI